MAQKDSLDYFQLAEAGDLSANYESDTFSSKGLDNIGICIETDGVTDNTGTFEIHKRYKKRNSETYGPWIAMTFSTTTILGDADIVHEFFIGQTNPAQFKVVFTAAGGTPDGTVNIYVSGCSVGG